MQSELFVVHNVLIVYVPQLFSQLEPSCTDCRHSTMARRTPCCICMSNTLVERIQYFNGAPLCEFCDRAREEERCHRCDGPASSFGWVQNHGLCSVCFRHDQEALPLMVEDEVEDIPTFNDLEPHPEPEPTGPPLRRGWRKFLSPTDRIFEAEMDNNGDYTGNWHWITPEEF